MKLSSLTTEIFSGEGCVVENVCAFSSVHRALIVTGKHGAAASGALSDVLSVLDSLGAEYFCFDRITENPPLETVYEAGKYARDLKVDTVIAIGGGSAIDGAKAIAAFAANPTDAPEALFAPEVFSSPGLPIIAIPTTSGTGSEVNSFSIITVDDGRKKRTFKNQWSTPAVAFVDPVYTYSLSREYSISCALDALAHAFESYLSPKSTDETRDLCALAASNIIPVLFSKNTSSSDERDAGGFTKKERSMLSLASNLAGQAIGVTGTGFPHPLGYNLTMAKSIPHGRACAAFYSEYIRLNMTVPEGCRLLTELCDRAGVAPEDAAALIPTIAPVRISLSEEEIADFVDRTSQAKNYENSPYVISREEMAQIYRRLFP